MGRLTRKVIAVKIKSKLCKYCGTFKRTYPDVPEEDITHHRCWRNHEGTSGSMEAAVFLELVVALFNKHNTIVRRLCCDDDSSVRADCQWSNEDSLFNHNTNGLPKVAKKHVINKGALQDRPDKGKLPRSVPEPLFVADLNHRRKGLTGELIKLDSQGWNSS
jgi:hypothetical protein